MEVQLKKAPTSDFQPTLIIVNNGKQKRINFLPNWLKADKDVRVLISIVHFVDLIEINLSEMVRKHRDGARVMMKAVFIGPLQIWALNLC